MYARATVAAATIRMNPTNFSQQLTIGQVPPALWPFPPCVIAAGTDFEYGAHHPNIKDITVALDEPEPHFGGPEKMPTTFFKMSRSICARSSSFRRRRISICS